MVCLDSLHPLHDKFESHLNLEICGILFCYASELVSMLYWIVILDGALPKFMIELIIYFQLNFIYVWGIWELKSFEFDLEMPFCWEMKCSEIKCSWLFLTKNISRWPCLVCYALAYPGSLSLDDLSMLRWPCLINDNLGYPVMAR